MAGFLKKKDRVIDFNLTERGRELMSKNSLEFAYATVSDKSIVYSEDYDSSEIRKISDSEFQYNSLEIETIKENNNFFMFEESTKDFYLNQYKSRTKLDDLIARKNLSTTDIRFEEDIQLKDSYLPDSFNIFDFRRYPTIRSRSSLSDRRNIVDDCRFKEKTNMMFMPPLNAEYDFDFNNEYIETGFLNFIKGFDYSNVNDNLDVSLVDYLENNKEIFRFYFELDRKSKNDFFMFDINQINVNKEFRDLKIIKYKTVFDKKKNKTKTIYLVGKFISNIENKKYYVLDHEELMLINSERSRKDFIFEQTADKLDLSQDYPSLYNFNTIESILNSKFVNIFTVIAE